jgi:hypothetical protein
MAQDSIISGLFGLTPEMYKRSQAEEDQAKAIEFARLSPLQQASAGFYSAGMGLGRGIGTLLGAEDPQLQMIAQQQQILKNVDMNDPESMAQAARVASASGNARLAAALAERSNAMLSNIAQRRASEAQTSLAAGRLTTLEQQQQKEDQLQKALADLPADASDQQLQNVLRRFGDSKTVLQSLERKSQMQLQTEARAELERERAQRREEEKAKDREFKLLLASLASQQRNATTDLQRQILQGKIDDAQAKRDEKIEKQLASAEGVASGTQVVLTKIDEAEKLLGRTTTGVGSYLSVIPGSDARALSSALATIKARLGFDQLQQMRNASPTGGALGQVAVKELEALQAALASLDQGLDQKTLKNNLEQIKTSYTNWRDAALGKVGKKSERESPAPQTSTATQPKPTKRFNPETGRLEDI